MKDMKVPYEALLPPLPAPNKSYIKKVKFIAKKKEAAAAAERGRAAIKKKSRGKAKGTSAVKPTVKTPKASAKKVSAKPVKKKRGVTAISTVEKVSKVVAKRKKKINNITAPIVAAGEAAAQHHELSKEEIDKQLIQRVISGEEGVHDTSSSALGVELGDPLQYPCLPFLEDYAEHKRSEVVSADAMLQKAHKYFKDFGKKESAIRRAAAKRLRELKDINRRGGDKDGFRYVVPRNAKELVQQMEQNMDATALDASRLVSTFGGDDVHQQENDISERPMHRRKRKKRCYSDFYQFQVSKRWTRNAENFLNRGRVHRSMFERTRQSRSIKKL